MSKITIALNSMIEHRDQITDVMNYKQTYYFRFLNYVWSIRSYVVENNQMFKNIIQLTHNPIHYSATYYPDYYSVADLKDDLEKRDESGKQIVEITSFVYSSETDKDRETYQTFRALFNLLREKLYNVDQVLEDIISFGENKES